MIKKNKNWLIAEFMDVKIRFVNLTHLNDRSFWMVEHTSKPVEDAHYQISYNSSNECLEYFVRDSKYDKSWDWLMPVIDKIETLGYTFMYTKEFYSVSIGDDKNMYRSDFVLGVKGKGINKLAAYYDAVVNFIQWYNKKILKKSYE